MLAWSTVATAFKLALRHLDPLSLLLVANVVSILALAVVMPARGSCASLRAATGSQRLHAATLGLLNPFLYYVILFQAYDRLPAQVAQPLRRS